MRTNDKDADMAPQPQPSILVPELQDAFSDNIRRRAATAATVSGGQQRLRWLAASTAIVAATVAAILLVLPFGGGNQGVMSPSRAVAAVTRTLDSNNSILHWVTYTEGPGPASRNEQWIDLRTGDRHASVTTRGRPSPSIESWVSADQLWTTVPGRSPDGRRSIRRIPSGSPTENGAFTAPTSIEGVRQLLERAERGEAEIADDGERDGIPLAVVTDRTRAVELRTWITREQEPRVIKIAAEVDSSRSATPVTTTTVTTTWEILPRSDARLALVALPPDADRLP